MRRPLIIIVLILLFGGISAARAGQVDLLEFGHIDVGMTEGEVLNRIGPPDYESFEGYTATNAVIKTYYYFSEPERYQDITSVIHFVGGRVVDKDRLYD